MTSTSKWQSRGGAGGPEQGLANAPREHVVEIEMQLTHHTHRAAALTVDRNDRLDADLIVVSDPDDARLDCTRGDETIAEIVGYRRRELNLDDRDQVVEKLRQPKV